ncbi:MAG: 3-dehydroquinate synthase [Lentisphaerae bacterium]|jgi:3-dehydroquinate synthase|nr:3-dehydroquinate synthase [Lentisphaerota bacterium]MBT4820921.1 3-dehydroquinate synthase [Lentisphaerota bacterium]MBT5608690.1 3-dehydroquinate synthase [Lentisphaerota bacterium]MBT7057687.1 3-dehydroquinate synthase [Lentisphaerota bacterium]MBT7841654.1 3-dehydroquinate synthase [Lentisphaerota bacterium]
MHTVPIRLEHTAYDIYIGRGLLDTQSAREALNEHVRNRTCLVVSDTNVAPLHAAQAVEALRASGADNVEVTTFRAGEASKTLATLEDLYHTAVTVGLDRSSPVVALGGGVVGDIAGFLAATYMRGVPFIQMPTSLLALVDSSVGGKVAVDLPEGKNLVGAFYQPKCVVADLDFLTTLPPREVRCGLGEVVKYGMIMDAEFFTQLAGHGPLLLDVNDALYVELVGHCCKLKAEVVEEDEREMGRRAILNYGHTFGHAVEALGGFGHFNHGEAIAIGMGMAVDLAESMGRISNDVTAQQDALLQACQLPIRADSMFGATPTEVLEQMKRDKKTSHGSLRVVLPARMGHVDVLEYNDREQLLEAIGGRLG